MKSIMMRIALFFVFLCSLHSSPAYSATERPTALVTGDSNYTAGSFKNPADGVENVPFKSGNIENLLAANEKTKSSAEKIGTQKTVAKNAAVKGKTDKESLYATAHELFRDGKYEKSREAFENFLKKYPHEEFSDNAQFWIGECYYFEKKYEKAIIAYDRMVKDFPKGIKVPYALIKEGLSFRNLGDGASAKILLQKVIKDFPKTTQARVAETQLKQLKPNYGKQDVGIHSSSFQKLPIAIPDFKPLRPGAVTDDLSVWFADTLSQDLLTTGYFNVIEKRAFAEYQKRDGITGENIRFKDWMATGAKYLIRGGFQTDGRQLITEFRLYDVLKGELAVGKRYQGAPDDKNRMVIAFRKAVLQALVAEEATSVAMKSSDKRAEKVPSPDSTAPVITIISPKVSRGVQLTAKDARVTIIGKATDASGVAMVVVNGETAVLDENGSFSADILLKVGKNRVIVSATDIHKNSSTETFTIVRKAGQVAKIPGATKPSMNISNGRYYALIIGNNNYLHLSRLQTAVNDATAMAKVLRDSYGFETRLLLNATRKDILSAMNSFRNKLAERDNLLIYYAGHGEFDRSAEKAYWLPIDALRDDPTDWIIADDVTSGIKRLSSKHVLIVSDSCYSGTLTRSAQTNLPNQAERDEFLKRISTRRSRTLMASGGNEPVTDGGGTGHSIFADCLLKALNEINNPIFTADELFYKYVRSRVAGRSDQVPVYSEIRNSGHDGGDFIFVKSE